jgi:carbon monoxide dehydrogenase subunit G
MLIKIALSIFAVIVLVLIYAVTRPDTFRVERSVLINATPEKVFVLINDLHKWAAWSTWEKMDPSMKKAHSGAVVGKGAIYSWEGNSKVGKGSMEITESLPSSKVQIKLDFVAPFEGHNLADIVLQPEGGGTRVVWSMYGPTPFITKVMGLFLDMDEVIGKDFEDSLTNLKQVVEKQQ